MNESRKEDAVTMSKMPDNYLAEEVRDGEHISLKTKKLFKASVEIIDKIDAICSKYGLSYYAGYGTLIGAIRHKGFIPWDDDVDLWMPRKDFDEFQQIAAVELPEYYSLQTCVTDPTMVVDLIRIRDSRTTATQKWQIDLKLKTHMGIWVSIFPLEGRCEELHAAESVLARKWFWTRLFENAYVSCQASFARRVCAAAIRFVFRLVGLKRVYRFRQRLGSVFPFEKYESCCSGTYLGGYVSVNLKRDWFRRSLDVPFEYSTIKVPVDYEKVLVALYGDWRKPVRGAADHEILDLEPDIPYKEFVEKKYGFRP